MKIQLVKDTDKKGDVWYILEFNGSKENREWFVTEERARERAAYLLVNGFPNPTTEVLEVFES